MGFRDNDEMLRMRAEALEVETAATRSAIADLRERIGENVEVVRTRLRDEELERLRAQTADARGQLARIVAEAREDALSDVGEAGKRDGLALLAFTFYLLAGADVFMAYVILFRR